jgi:hypothetical protein
VAIETLSDDVLLEIFDLCLDKFEDEDIDPWYDMGDEEDERHSYDAWYALAHVCQSWRYVVFASPRRLKLRLHCSRRRVREMLGVWPAFPIVVWDIASFISDEDNIIAALEHRDRVCEIKLGHLTGLQLEKLVPLMQESFPALTKLQIGSYSLARDKPALVLPDSFLGGSAPHLVSSVWNPFHFQHSRLFFCLQATSSAFISLAPLPDTFHPRCSLPFLP